jgi:hypothetical protein
MTCSDLQRVLPEILDGSPDSALKGELQGSLPADFDAHLKSCPDCSDLVSDLALIASEAHQLAATEEPAPRVWVRIAAELRAEGIIREPESAPLRPVLVPATARRRWSALWLAPVAAAIVAAGAYVVNHQPKSQMALQQTPVKRTASLAETEKTVAKTPVVPPVAVPQATPETPAPQQVATKDAPPVDTVKPDVEPGPNAEDQQFLRAVSTQAPSMRATYENQLQAVNADIRETQAYVDRNPGDVDARQHLMDAYEQKALLYQIALDRIQ